MNAKTRQWRCTYCGVLLTSQGGPSGGYCPGCGTKQEKK